MARGGTVGRRDAEATGLPGNRWVLVGSILYMLEWVAIIAGGVWGVNDTAVRGLPVDDMYASYVGNADAVAFMAGWFAVFLLGRILIFIGLRQVLRDSGRPHVLMDFAVAAAAVSVTLEIAAYGLSMIAASLVNAGERAAAHAVDQAGAGLNLMLAGGLGVAIVCSVYCMWRSQLFPRPLNILGLIAGMALIGGQLSVPPSLQTLLDILYISPLLFWIWMLWAGVMLWRRTPRTASRPGLV